jgi:hypothetical protein
MKFVFKKFRAAIRIPNILGGVSTRGNLQANGAALELCVDRSDALPMRVIESFRDAKNRSEAPGKPLIGIAQGAVRRMIIRWLRFPVVITNRRGDEISLAPG